MLAFHRSLTAGEETGLSCSHDGYPSVPRPLRHRVLRCCISKFFTPSMAFAHGHQARLPVGPFRGKSSRRGRLRFMLRTRGLHSPIEPAPGSWGSSTPRVDAQSLPPRRRGSPRTPAGCYRGGLVPPLAGLSPASLRELPGRTARQRFVQPAETAKRATVVTEMLETVATEIRNRGHRDAAGLFHIAAQDFEGRPAVAASDALPLQGLVFPSVFARCASPDSQPGPRWKWSRGLSRQPFEPQTPGRPGRQLRLDCRRSLRPEFPARPPVSARG